MTNDSAPVWELVNTLRDVNVRVEAERNQLRAALVTLVGMDGRTELEQLEAVMRATPMPAQDRAGIIDAIHALIATLR